MTGSSHLGGGADIFDVGNNEWSRASTCATASPTQNKACLILGVAGDKLLAYTVGRAGSDGRVWLFDPTNPNEQAWTETANAPYDPDSLGYALYVKGDSANCANCNRLLTAGPRRPESGDSLRAELYKPKPGSTPTPPTTLLPPLPTVPVP